MNTTIDLSRARGLTNRFIDEMEAKSREGISKLDSWRRGKKLAHYRGLLDKFDRSLFLSSHLGGSNNNPFAFVCCLDGSHVDDKGSHGDRLVSVSIYFIEFARRGLRSGEALGLSISTHAIQRLYQRVPTLDLNGPGICLRQIMAQFAYCEVCTVFWTLLILNANLDEDDAEHVSIPIPAEHGVLLAKWDAENHSVAVRTFVDLEKMTPDQKKLRAAMIETFDLFKDSLVKYALPVITQKIPEVSDKKMKVLIPLLMHHASQCLPRDMAFQVFRGHSETGFTKHRERRDFGAKMEASWNDMVVVPRWHNGFLNMYIDKGEAAVLRHFEKIEANTLRTQDLEESKSYHFPGR